MNHMLKNVTTLTSIHEHDWKYTEEEADNLLSPEDARKDQTAKRNVFKHHPSRNLLWLPAFKEGWLLSVLSLSDDLFFFPLVLKRRILFVWTRWLVFVMTVLSADSVNDSHWMVFFYFMKVNFRNVSRKWCTKIAVYLAKTWTKHKWVKNQDEVFHSSELSGCR